MFWVDGGRQRSNLSVMQPNELWHSSSACVDRSWQRGRMATTDAKSVVKMASMKRPPKKRTWKPLWGSSCSGAAVGRPKQIKPMTEHCARPPLSSHTLAFHTSLRARHARAKQQPERTRHDASCGTCTPPAMRTLLKLNRSRSRLETVCDIIVSRAYVNDDNPHLISLNYTYIINLNSNVDYFSKGGSSCVERVHQTM